MRRVHATSLAVLVAALMLVPAARAQGVQCAPKPDDPVGYEIRAVKADALAPPATTPPIAVLDSGVSPVPELAGRLREGQNLVTGGRNTTDTDGHGTAVASVAAASAGGVRGVSPTSPVIPIKIFDARGQATAERVIGGIRRALELGARVINISASASGDDVDPAADRLVRDAVLDAVTRGVVVVAPSGNDGASSLAVPAAYPHVLAVGATDIGGTRAGFSNSGRGIDLVAPGEGLTTAAPAFLCASGYGRVSGTSFAAPAVAGAAALLLQARPELEPGQVADVLRLRGQLPAPAWSPSLGFGLLDVAAALASPVPAADAPEVDDTVAWSKRHPPVLASPRRDVRVSARVAERTDPADVFRVRLRRGDRLQAGISALTPGARLRLSVSDGRRVLKRGKRFSVRARRSSTYFVAVALAAGPPAGAHYTLALRRR